MTSAARASFSTSSATMNSGRPAVATLLSRGSRSARLAIFFSQMSTISASSRMHSDGLGVGHEVRG